MSSILDALSKVDQTDPERVSAAVFALPPPAPPRSRVPLVVGVGAAVVGLAAVAGWYLRRETPAPIPVPPPAAVAEVPAVAPAVAPPVVAPVPETPPVAAPPTTIPAPVAPVAAIAPPPSGPAPLPVVGAVAPPTDSAPGQQPWVRTIAPTPPPPPPEEAPPPPTPVMVPVRPAPTLPPMPTTPPAARGVFVAPKPSPADRPVRLPEPPPGTEELSGVRVSFLAYSRKPELRTVALSLEGGSLVTLREGERAGDLQVTQIYPDRVDLTRGGAPFTVRAR